LFDVSISIASRKAPGSPCKKQEAFQKSTISPFRISLTGIFVDQSHAIIHIAGIMSDPSRGIHRTIVLLRFLATADGRGRRLKDIADAAGPPRPTTHRILASLVAEGMVERDAGAKDYRLGLDLFMLDARAGNPMNLRELCRPALLRLTGSLGETIFLLVRSGFDAIWIDRTAGLLPIRSFTGDIGGSVMLGIGQARWPFLRIWPPANRTRLFATICRACATSPVLTKHSCVQRWRACARKVFPTARKDQFPVWRVKAARCRSGQGSPERVPQ
jgi:hypothetical protein